MPPIIPESVRLVLYCKLNARTRKYKHYIFSSYTTPASVDYKLLNFYEKKKLFSECGPERRNVYDCSSNENRIQNKD